MIKYIENLYEPEVSIFSKLTERELRNGFENKKGIFIAESPKVIERALDFGYEPISFLMEEKHIEGDAHSIINRCPNIPVYTSSREVLESLTGYKLTRGVLCAFYRKQELSFDYICKKSHRIAVLENIADSTNVGAIFRSAAALGIDGILLTPECADPLSRRSIRVSMGNVFHIDWGFIGEKNTDWPEKGMNLLKQYGFKTISMALRNSSIEINNNILKSEDKLAILLGTEGEGLLSYTIEKSDYIVKIPMKQGIDSLNVAAAAAIIFYELGKKYENSDFN